MSKNKPKCQHCGSDNVAAIVFGYPSEELFEASGRGEVVLGGCCVTENDPEWHCKDCEHKW